MKETRAAILGLARSGTALAAALVSRGLRVRAGDARPESEISSAAYLRQRGVELFFGGPDASLLGEAQILAVSPGVPLSHPLVARARRRGLPVLSELEVAWRILEEEKEGRNRYLAVTGTNGKSTVATWIAEILRRAGRPVALAGNIGVPLSEFCASREGRDFVVEVSSFQLETSELFRPDVAVVTNLTPDHLDRHGTLEDYVSAKAKIFARQLPADAAVLNHDDPLSRRFDPPSRRVRFSRLEAVAPGAWVEAGQIVVDVDGRRCDVVPVAEVSLPGVHNLENALAAAAACACAGVPADVIALGLREFEGLPHRSRKVGEIGGVAWINDSKGTNPDAVLKSLAGYPDGRVVLILGGSDKGSDFSILLGEVRRACRQVLTIGKSAPRIEESLAGCPVRRAGTMEAAVEAAGEIARPGDTVLLSPACASFDQYANFEARGEHFETLVRSRREAVGHGA
jgi:UDP-N-acetylmuramoylalanine--D-glutamate ligase